MAPRLQPLALVLLRFAVAWVFFTSGLVKIEDFSNTVALFQDEYNVPVLPPVVAAIFATGFELLCPVLLVLGLATRVATLPLLAMTAVIQFTYDQNIQHAYWALMLLTLLAFGAGKISLDACIHSKVNR
jgi:putative oxidoreductase